MKARKKPVEIDYFSIVIKENTLDQLIDWVKSFGDSFEEKFEIIDQGPDGASLMVKTLEGTSYSVTKDDIVIRGVKGEYYPCKKDIFLVTYDLL